MKCPRCGAENSDDEWNCVSCRINLYWATQHYDGLAEIRERQGLPESASARSSICWRTGLISCHATKVDTMPGIACMLAIKHLF